MAEENYEAVGRYVKAKEAASDASAKRHNVLGDLSRSINETLRKGQYGEAFAGFNADQAIDLIKQASALNEQMMRAVDEANKYAKMAGKPELRKV
jgi:hypothetical protein